MNQYHRLYTPANSAIVFIDQQPQMTFGVASIDRATLINNVTLLARVAKEFNVPAVLTAIETDGLPVALFRLAVEGKLPGEVVLYHPSLRFSHGRCGIAGCHHDRVMAFGCCARYFTIGHRKRDFAIREFVDGSRTCLTCNALARKMGWKVSNSGSR